MRKVLCLLLCCVFCFMIIAVPASQPAKAVVVSTVIIGTVIAAMAAAGIGLSVSGITSTQLSDWVSGKLQSWATSLGGSVEDHINGNLITTTASGIISIGTSAANSIAHFLGWLQTDEDLSDNSSSTVIGGNVQVLPISLTVPNKQEVIDNGYLTAVDPSGTPRYRYFMSYGSAQNPVALVYYFNSSDSIMIAASKANQCICYFAGIDSNLRTQALGSYNSTLDFYYTQFVYPSPWTCNVPQYANEQECLQALANYLDGNTGSLSIDTGVITIPIIDTTSQDKWFLDVGAVPGVTIQDATDGVIADTISGDLTVSGEVAESEPEFDITGPVAVPGITEVFPFCIPFDLAAFATCLVADPVCPHFEIPFVIPGLVDYTFVIDLSAFEAVAQILRTMELLLFCVGLAFVTRKLLRS